MKYFLIVAILVILIGGGYFFAKGNSTKQQNTPTIQNSQQGTQLSSAQSKPTAMQTKNAVNYTEDGFQPNTITIKVGQTVTWTNRDSDDLWVASNPHPVHTDYPGFDELKGMPTGQMYSFTFTKLGKWGYHNHLNPSQMGVVVVTQ